MIFSSFRWNSTTVLELTKPKAAYIYYRKTRLNLLTGFPETYSFDQFLSQLSKVSLQGRVKDPKVYHFYYDLGLLMMGLGHTVGEDTPLVMEIEYETSRKTKNPSTNIKNVQLKSLERPSWSEYKDAFEKIQEHLLDGNCYQVNLTYPYDFETEDMIDPRDLTRFFFAQKGLSSYSHVTYTGEEMILSNSPECLFQYRNNEVFTMPIKGTKKRGRNWKESWHEMQMDPKEEGELNMISDLLKNDLNRLEYPRAQILKSRAPLLVPGLLHQYSLLSVRLEKPVSLLHVLKCLFPGGSVTGAPKKRVMEIIQEVERYSRGIYCGSTLLCYQDKKVASINIRTASINISERLWRYGAGGGITLLSRPADEFVEMEAKVASFLTLLKTPGY